jgi:hypothetical protein
MPNSSFFLQFAHPSFYIKIGAIVIVVFYFILSLIIARRIQIMNRVISQSQVSFLIAFISFLNIALAFLLFLLAVVIL